MRATKESYTLCYWQEPTFGGMTQFRIECEVYYQKRRPRVELAVYKTTLSAPPERIASSTLSCLTFHLAVLTMARYLRLGSRQ